MRAEDSALTSADAPRVPSDANLSKLWVYTNYDCNLHCTYCVAGSGPRVPRRALGLEVVRRLVDEANELRCAEILFTGGEPFLLDEIYEMLAYASARSRTTVLTNGYPLRGKRLDRLSMVNHPNLVVQVSLDGGKPEHHDAYRGAGSWRAAVAAVDRLRERGIAVRVATTETPANRAHLAELCAFHLSLGIPEEDHFIRPLARGGHSREGLEIDSETLVPELTVNAEGVHWHPLVTDGSILVSPRLFPLREAVERLHEALNRLNAAGKGPQRAVK